MHHLGFNILHPIFYERYIKSGRNPKSGDEIPYFSFSSMSPLIGGIGAMMKEINPDLTPVQYKQILIKSSKSFNYKNKSIEKVLDAPSALNFLQKVPISKIKTYT